MKAQFEESRAEFEAWAEENGINVEDLKGDREGKRGHGKKRGGAGFGEKSDQQSDAEIAPASAL